MKITSVFFIYLIWICFGESRLQAQATDNTGKDLFVVKSTSGFSFPLSSTGFSINYTSSYNPVDSVEIGPKKFRRNKGHNTSRKSFIFDQQAHKYYMIITRRPAGLQTYYAGKEVNEAFGKLSQDQEYYFEYKNINLWKKPDSLVDRKIGYILALHIPFDSVPTVTDIGTWVPRPLFLNLKVSNLTYKSLGQFFTYNNQPTIQLELGFIQNSVIKFNNWDSLEKPYNRWNAVFAEYDLFYSAYVNFNCINYYDLTTGKPTTYGWSTFSKFNQYGIKINFNGYFSRTVALAFTANTWLGLPLETDKAYQLGQSAPIFPGDTLFRALKQTAGKYGGDINKKLANLRLSLAFPIFINLIFNAPTLYLLPSYAPYINTGSSWTQQVGLSLNLLSKPYGGLNSSIVQAGGIGFDILSNSKAKTGWGSPLFYVSGSINLNSIIPTSGTKSKFKKE